MEETVLGEERDSFFLHTFFMATFGKSYYVLIQENNSSELSKLVSVQTVSSHLSWVMIFWLIFGLSFDLSLLV